MIVSSSTGRKSSTWHESSAVRETVVVMIGFALVAVLVTMPLAIRATSHLPGDLADPLLNTWILAWDADRLRHGLQGLWDAPIFYPAKNTLAFSEHLLGIAVLVAPVQGLTGNPVLAYNVAILLGFVIAASGMYLLVRSLSGRRDLACIAGLAYAFNPYRSLQMTHVQVLMSGWMPIALWALHRYFASGSLRLLAACVAAFVMQGLSNGYFLFFQIIPLGIVAIAEVLWRRPPLKRTLVHGCLAAVIVASVFLPIGTAYARVGLAEPSRTDRTGVDLSGYFKVAPFNPAWYWWPWKPSEKDKPVDERLLFPGLTLLTLAGIGAVCPPGEREWRRIARVYGIITLLALIISLGSEPTAWGVPVPVGWFYSFGMQYVPGFSVLRVPARLATVVVLGLAVLAAAGASRVLQGSRGRLRSVAAIALPLLVLLEGVPYMWFERFDPDRPPNERAAYGVVRTGPPGAVVEFPMRGAMGPIDLTREYQYNTLKHGRPIVNGHSRYSSALNRFLIGPGSPLLERDQLPHIGRMFRSVGVRYIVIRREAYASHTLAQATYDALVSDREHVRERRSFGPVDLFELAPPIGPMATLDSSNRVVSGGQFQVSTSTGQGELARAFDDDTNTAWSSGRRQAGHETVDVQFDRGRDIARVRFGMLLPYWWDYPRRLRVESWDDRGVRTILFQDTVLPIILRGLFQESRTRSYAMDVDLAPNRSSRLRLAQIGSSRRAWSIGELTFIER